MNIQEAIAGLIDGSDLKRKDMVSVMDAIMSGESTDAQIGAFLVALRIKGETVDEIRGAAEVMREKSTKIKTHHSVIVDTCGTGGDHSNTFNISTTSAFVAAGAGLCVAKHGNRSVTSRSGSADVLQVAPRIGLLRTDQRVIGGQGVLQQVRAAPKLTRLAIFSRGGTNSGWRVKSRDPRPGSANPLD